MATGDTVQQIKERVSIVDVISPYVELHKAGKNMKGKSPFTSEKTPSFYVSPERGMYYCFSSSQGGDIFTFIEKMEGVDFKGALKILADKAGIELVPEDPKKRDERDTLYQVLEEATRFFEAQLTKEENAKGYLKDRGTKDETISKWRIGYAPDDWRQLKEYLNKKGYEDKVLLQAGLVKSADGGKQPYDVFRDRIMFPIFDPSGRVVAFSGRLLKKDDKAPKYVNSPETMLFNKSEILFGYDKAKHGIHKLDFSLVVEGQFDVVLSHQAGYNNTVAVSGTALTAHHAGLLQRLSNRVVLALDADRAGISAVKRAAELMLGRGIDLKVARIQEGKDPADLVKDNPQLLKQTIGHATHVIEFLLSIVKEEAVDERRQKLRVRDEILPYVLHLDSHIEREHFISLIAESINTTADAIRLEVLRLEDKAAADIKQPDTAVEKKVEENTRDPQARKIGLIHYLAIMDDLLPIAEKHLLGEQFAELTGKTTTEIRSGMPANKISELTFKLEQYIADHKPMYVREEWEDKLKQLQSVVLREKVAITKAELVAAEQAGDEKIAAEKLAELEKLRKEFAV